MLLMNTGPNVALNQPTFLKHKRMPVALMDPLSTAESQIENPTPKYLVRKNSDLRENKAQYDENDISKNNHKQCQQKKQKIKGKNNEKSDTVNILKKEITHMKNQVAKLIEEGFSYHSLTFDNRDSSALFSSISKGSHFSAIVTTDHFSPFTPAVVKQNCSPSSSTSAHQEELSRLKQVYDALQSAYIVKENEYSEIILKCSILEKQLGILQQTNISLTDRLQVLQQELQNSKQQLEYYAEYCKCLAQEQQKTNDTILKHEANFTQMKRKLEEQISHRKAENNELIKIIEIKQVEIVSLSQRIQAIQEQNMGKLGTARVSGASAHCEYFQPDFKMQVKRIMEEIQEKEHVMAMMLNDIREMDKELLVFDQEHQQLLKCRKLIGQLNEHILKLDMKRLAQKYRHY